MKKHSSKRERKSDRGDKERGRNEAPEKPER